MLNYSENVIQNGWPSRMFTSLNMALYEKSMDTPDLSWGKFRRWLEQPVPSLQQDPKRCYSRSFGSLGTYCRSSHSSSGSAARERRSGNLGLTSPGTWCWRRGKWWTNSNSSMGQIPGAGGAVQKLRMESTLRARWSGMKRLCQYITVQSLHTTGHHWDWEEESLEIHHGGNRKGVLVAAA